MNLAHLLALAFTLVPLLASAQNNSTTGAYVGVNGIVSFENFDLRGLSFDDGVGAGARLGSRLDSGIGIEAQYEWSGRFEDSAQGFLIDLEQHVLTANLRLFLASGPFEPYLTLGVGYGRADVEVSGFGTRTDSDADGLAFRGGLGVQIPLLPSVGMMISGDYVLPTGDIAGLDYFSLGIGLNLHLRGL